MIDYLSEIKSGIFSIGDNVIVQSEEPFKAHIDAILIERAYTQYRLSFWNEKKREVVWVFDNEIKKIS